MGSQGKRGEEKLKIYIGSGIIVLLLIVIILLALLFFKERKDITKYVGYPSPGENIQKGYSDATATTPEGVGVKTTYLVTVYAAGNGAGKIVGQGIKCGADDIDCDERAELEAAILTSNQ